MLELLISYAVGLIGVAAAAYVVHNLDPHDK